MKFLLREFNGDETVTIDIKFTESNINCDYFIDDKSDLVWPKFTKIERKEELWKSTCFELFLSSPTDTSYIEMNCSPSGGWNCYSFSDYREGMTKLSGAKLTALKVENKRKISVSFFLPQLPNRLLLGPAAILSNNEGVLTYFSTAHGEKPDFHERDHHVLFSDHQL